MTTQQEATGSVAPPTSATRAEPDWLALRREADTEARDGGASWLLDELVEHLRRREAAAVRVVDVGAGTGANHAYLSPRLPFEQSWVVVDHDADLLAHAGHGPAVRVQAGVCDLLDVLDELAAESDGTPMLLTCAALLDVLTTEELTCLADTIERSGAPALLSLTVTGGITWSPPDEADELVARLFDEHQRRDGRAGPDAATVLREELERRGLRVRSARTPWLLDAGRRELVRRWLDERVGAALDQLTSRNGEPQVLADWHARRLGQLASAGLVAHVDHVDLLVLPD